MNLSPQNELELYEMFLTFHMAKIVEKLSVMSTEHWDWTPHEAAPTARKCAEHALQWLICDRQHILELNAKQHALVPESPTDREEFCRAFDKEIENWRNLLQSLQPEELNDDRHQFGFLERSVNVRFFIGHMFQNVVYKHGQISELFFALGYDGDSPYTAPLPNPIYQNARQL